MKTAQEIADQTWLEMSAFLPEIMDKVNDACVEILASNIAEALADERAECAETARDGGMHYSTEQDIRDSVANAIMARPTIAPIRPKHRTIDVTIFGHDVPVDVMYTGDPSDDELYEMAKDLLRRAL